MEATLTDETCGEHQVTPEPCPSLAAILVLATQTKELQYLFSILRRAVAEGHPEDIMLLIKTLAFQKNWCVGEVTEGLRNIISRKNEKERVILAVGVFDSGYGHIFTAEELPGLWKERPHKDNWE